MLFGSDNNFRVSRKKQTGVGVELGGGGGRLSGLPAFYPFFSTPHHSSTIQYLTQIIKC